MDAVYKDIKPFIDSFRKKLYNHHDNFKNYEKEAADIVLWFDKHFEEYNKHKEFTDKLNSVWKTCDILSLKENGRVICHGKEKYNIYKVTGKNRAIYESGQGELHVQIDWFGEENENPHVTFYFTEHGFYHMC